MANDEGFLSEIAEAWEDDAPRLIYADWLEERGDPRAEFLRLECQLASRSLADKRARRLRARFHQLAEMLDREWLLCVSRLRDLLGAGAEEVYARALRRQLSRELASKLPGTAASVSGEGCHWACQAERGRRSCTVHCFESSGPEFLVYFEEQSARAISGRTPEQAEVVGAVCGWLSGQSAQSLHSQFNFVERQRRALEKFQQGALASQPQLAEVATWELVTDEWGGDGCALWFRRADRSCSCAAGHHAHKGAPGVDCYWDECLQLSIRDADEPTAAALLKRWLCDNAMPSAIQRELPSVALSDVAQYYEQGRGIEGEFIGSWGHVEQFYKMVQHPFALRVLNFIGQLRAAGYERTLRAGTSLFSLIVSRSRRYGLRPGQPYIAFSFGGARFTGGAIAPETMEVAVCFGDGERRASFAEIELSADLDALLK
jgi:uncharacterized protein (TIGR02996 family)